MAPGGFGFRRLDGIVPDPLAEVTTQSTDSIMSSRPGRNDPCHCGSGRKYKHCHLREDETAGAKALSELPQGVLDLALDWLQAKHRKGFARSYERLLDTVWPEHREALHPEALETGLQQAVIANLSEHLLARGEIGGGEHWQSISDLVLAEGGPSLTAAHRDFLSSLASEPLRLYRIGEVHEGVGCSVVDVTETAGVAGVAMDGTSAALNIDDPLLSGEDAPGMLIGARLVKVADRIELSGALYPIAPELEADLIDALAEAIEACIEDGASPVQTAMEIELTLIECWLWQIAVPAPMSSADSASREANTRD